MDFCFVKHNVESYFCCCCFCWLFFEILTCSPTSYMLWSLYVWHSELVTRPRALSEVPKRLRGRSVGRLFTQFQKSKDEPAPPESWEVELFPESLVFPDGRCCTKKKTQKRQERYCLMSINETSSIIFHSETFRCKYSGTSQYPTHTHTHIHWLAVSSWRLAQESTTFSCSCPHSTDRRCTFQPFLAV